MPGKYSHFRNLKRKNKRKILSSKCPFCSEERHTASAGKADKKNQSPENNPKQII